MTDLLRVYGTLCWNLSQITGRKDIPMIHLTYSPTAAKKPEASEDPKPPIFTIWKTSGKN
jgi:EH domain-containing protein 1